MYHMIPLDLIPQLPKCSRLEVWRENIEDELGVPFAHAVSGLQPAQINLAGAGMG
jgi:hypothetical protein